MMTIRISDLHIALEEALPAPSELHAALPVGDTEAEHIARSRNTVQQILAGGDDRLLVITGPCSIHEPESALDYARRLREFAGVPAASEILDLVTPQYYAELLAWGAIGARTTESPLHRQMASALSAPVGFKNPMSGNVQPAVDAIIAAAQPHKFPSISLDGRAIVVTTTGNPHCHLVLRGGREQPNFDERSVKAAVAALEGAGLPSRLMVDCSHGNSGGDHRRQPIVAAELAAQIASGSRGICAVMLESHLVEGRQDIRDGRHGLRYGQSVTDACMGWETTTQVLAHLADAARRRRDRA
jgi:3-deoxy-7-phosphoheptulonate synthase